MVKAIDTHFDGHLFRSRLEARWAYYFRELGVSYLYEHEGFELGEGLRYLPDFFFPQWNLFAEIKPDKYTFQEHNKCRRLANITGNTVIELIGYPNVNPSTVIQPSKYYVCSKCGFMESYDFDGNRQYCECKAKHKIVSRINEVDGVLLLHSDKTSYKPIYYTSYVDVYTNDKVIQKAIEKAKKARFEFQKV